MNGARTPSPRVHRIIGLERPLTETPLRAAATSARASRSAVRRHVPVAGTGPCDQPLSANETGCGTTPMPIDVRNVYAESDVHYFTAFEGIVTQQSVWTFRVARAR